MMSVISARRPHQSTSNREPNITVQHYATHKTPSLVSMAPIKALESMHMIQAGVERDGENMVKKIKGVIQFIIKGGDDGAWAATRR